MKNFIIFLNAFLSGLGTVLFSLTITTLIFNFPIDLTKLVLLGSFLLGGILYFPIVWLIRKVKQKWNWTDDHSFFALAAIGLGGFGICLLVQLPQILSGGVILILLAVFIFAITVVSAKKKEPVGA